LRNAVRHRRQDFAEAGAARADLAGGTADLSRLAVDRLERAARHVDMSLIA